MKTLNLFSFLRTYAGFVLLIITSSLNSCQQEFFEVSPDYVYIYDTTLEEVNHDSLNYENPTILVYPNLTTVTNSVNFDRCINVKEILFPNLVSVGGKFAKDPQFRFFLNQGLERIEIPVLNTVFGYVDITHNPSLDATKGLCTTIDVYSYIDQAGNCKDFHVWVQGNRNNDSCLSYTLHPCD